MMRKDWVETELDKACNICDHLRKPINSKERAKRIEGKKISDLYPYYGATGQVGFIDDYLTDGEYVLIGEDGAPFFDYTKNIAYMINGKTWVNNHAHILLSKFNNKFLLHYLNQFNFNGFVSGTTRLKLTQGSLKKIPVKLAPLPEQRAIVAKIEKLFSDLDNGIANLKVAKAKLDIYRQAVLKKAFEGELTKEWRKSYKGQTASDLFKKIKIQREELFTQRYNDWIIKYEGKNASEKKKPAKPKKPVFGVSLTDNEIQNMPNSPNSWHILRFIDLIKYEDNGIKRGPFGSAIKKVFFVPSGFKVYEQQNAIRGDSRLGTYYIDEKKYKELEKFSVKGGDYIVSCSGTIGRIHKLDYDCEPGLINQALLKIVLDEQLMRSKYFFYLFRSEVFQRKILKGTRGTGMQNLASVDEIKQLQIQLPSIDEQLQIVQEIESRLSVCDKLAESIDQSLEKAEGLRQIILKKAFAGQLLNEAELAACRREPDWEPAAKLLEQIKKNKSDDAKNATTGKSRKANKV